MSQASKATESAVDASRIFVAIAVASLDAVDQQVTLPQYRALVVLDANDRIDLASLAGGMGVGASSASRLVDRLVAAGLVDRELDPANRRHVILSLTAAGRGVIDTVVAFRRVALDKILAAMTPADRDRLGELFGSFLSAARDVSPWHTAATL